MTLSICSVKTSKWVGDCFIYTTASNKLSYLIGDQSHVINHFDQPMYLLGYIPAQSRLYLADKDVNVYSYTLSVAVIDYQTAVLRGDMDGAAAILPTIPTDQRSRVARFLEAQDLQELAISVTTDADHKFDLAIALDDLDVALDLARSAPQVGSEPKWKTVGDKALAAWKIDLAEECFKNAGDLPALLLIYSSVGSRDGMAWLAKTARELDAQSDAHTRSALLTDESTYSFIRPSRQEPPQHCLHGLPPARRRCVLCRPARRDRSNPRGGHVCADVRAQPGAGRRREVAGRARERGQEEGR